MKGAGFAVVILISTVLIFLICLLLKRNSHSINTSSECIADIAHCVIRLRNSGKDSMEVFEDLCSEKSSGYYESRIVDGVSKLVSDKKTKKIIYWEIVSIMVSQDTSLRSPMDRSAP